MATGPAGRPPRPSIRLSAVGLATTQRPVSATPPGVGVGWGWTLRSEGRSITPERTANLRTSGVATNAAPALAPKTIRYGITLLPRLRSVRREPLAERADPLPCILLHAIAV